jgi:hypothetical protein
VLQTLKTEGEKRLGTLHASCAIGNLNNRHSDPITAVLSRVRGVLVFRAWDQALIACGGCRRFLEGLNGGFLVVVDFENGIQPRHLQQVLDFLGEVDEL